MKIASYSIDGTGSFGVVVDDGVVDRRHLADCAARTVGELLNAGGLESLAPLTSRPPDYRLDELTFDLPVPDPGKIVCVGRNYPSYHEVKETNEKLAKPSIFGRFPTSFAAHGEDIHRPASAEKLDYEGELVVVIGTPGRNIPAARAMNHVAGYTIANEGTLRDWLWPGTQNLLAKNFDRSGGMGPWIATRDEIGDVEGIAITTRRNGEVVHTGTTGSMIFEIPFLVSHISAAFSLSPGDLILTGSPGGSVIDTPNRQWLRPGESVEVEIEGIGTLRNSIAEDPAQID